MRWTGSDLTVWRKEVSVKTHGGKEVVEINSGALEIINLDREIDSETRLNDELNIFEHSNKLAIPLHHNKSCVQPNRIGNILQTDLNKDLEIKFEQKLQF